MGILTTLLSPYIAYVGFQKAESEPHQEMRNYLFDRFEYGRKLNSSFLERLSNQSENSTIEDNPLVLEPTFKKAISLLQNSLTVVFNIDTLHKIKSTKGWTPFHQNMLDRIEETIERLHRMNKVMLFYI